MREESEGKSELRGKGRQAALRAPFIGRGRKREGRKREGAELGQPAIKAAVMVAVTVRGRRGGEGVVAALMAAFKAGVMEGEASSAGSSARRAAWRKEGWMEVRDDRWGPPTCHRQQRREGARWDGLACWACWAERVGCAKNKG